MQEKTLPKPKIRTSNIHSMDFGSVSYDIFGSPYQKSGALQLPKGFEKIGTMNSDNNLPNPNAIEKKIQELNDIGIK